MRGVNAFQFPCGLAGRRIGSSHHANYSNLTAVIMQIPEGWHTIQCHQADGKPAARRALYIRMPSRRQARSLTESTKSACIVPCPKQQRPADGAQP
jgi:hypothetical protein